MRSPPGGRPGRSGERRRGRQAGAAPSASWYGFVDGNKRVPFACLDIFLGLNGARLEAEPDEVIAFIYHHLEAGTFRKDVLDEWLRVRVTAS